LQEEEGCLAEFHVQACGRLLKTLWLVCPGGGAVPQRPLDRLASPITDRQLMAQTAGGVLCSDAKTNCLDHESFMKPVDSLQLSCTDLQEVLGT
jgi:hypothetical protein